MATRRGKVEPYARGRRGGASVVDSIVSALKKTGAVWPVRTFPELQASVSTALGYPVPSSTIRSTIYARSELFERTERDGRLAWTLSAKARKP